MDERLIEVLNRNHAALHKTKGYNYGKNVSTDVEVIYDENTSRPRGFSLNYVIDGAAFCKRIIV